MCTLYTPVSLWCLHDVCTNRFWASPEAIPAAAYYHRLPCVRSNKKGRRFRRPSLRHWRPYLTKRISDRDLVLALGLSSGPVGRWLLPRAACLVLGNRLALFKVRITSSLLLLQVRELSVRELSGRALKSERIALPICWPALMSEGPLQPPSGWSSRSFRRQPSSGSVP